MRNWPPIRGALAAAPGWRLVAAATPGGVAMAALALLIPPVVLVIRARDVRHVGDVAVLVPCFVLYLLMFAGLWGIASSNRRGLFRERTLRVASAALASAGSVAEVAAAVATAARSLLPDVPADRAAVLMVGEDERLRQVDPSGAEPTAAGDPVSLWLSLADARSPKFVTISEIRAARSRLVPGAPRSAAPVRVPYEGALLCPLTLQDRPVGDPFIGLLGFFGDERALRGLTPVYAVLAGQAALAVERLELSAEVVRQRGEALFRTLVQDASEAILIIGDDRRIRYATPSAARLFGTESVEDEPVAALVAPGMRDDVDRMLDLILAPGGAGLRATRLRVDMRDGRVLIVEAHWSDLRHDPTVGGLVLTLRDVTEQHELHEELKRRAFHDELTGLPNRTLFAKRASAALEAVRDTERTVGVLFVDLDDFKIVNDTMGHAVGDDLLTEVAVRLAASVRKTDTAARLGGDEFALLIDDAADPDAVCAFAERIVAAFAEPFLLHGAELLVAATVGVSTSADSSDVDELLRHADLALYAAKSAGKRRWRQYQPALTRGMQRRRELQEALEVGLREEQFELAYQPIVSLASGRIAGFEALVRWPHPEWGMMLPGEFIPHAEESGLIVPLGGWVLRQALSDLVRWRSALGPRAGREPGGPHVSVNVSARQFRDPGFVDSVRQALHASGLPPSALLLELTESLLYGGNTRIHAELDQLKSIGVGLAIDDFGTGYSSLSYLLDLPIDVLKVDRSFVTGIASSWRRHALVEGIVRMARTLEVEVIAEGIEHQNERELLAEMGCQFGQGYLLSVPVDADAAEEMLDLGRALVPELPRQQRRSAGEGRHLTDL